MEPFNAIILIKLMHVTLDMLTKGGQHERFLTFLVVSHLMLSESVRQGLSCQGKSRLFGIE